MTTSPRIKVLVVDDNHEILSIFSEIFKDSDLSIFTTDNGQSAILEMRNEEYDVAFIDVYMPNMNGLTTLKELKKIDPDLIAVMISGYKNESMLEEALKIGADEYLFKPLDIQSIMSTVVKCAKKMGIDEHLEIIQ